jgi:hypothetical protein
MAKSVTLPPKFTSLGPKISLYTPPSHNPRELILLCTWLGAARKHIDKYASAYHLLAPNAQILILESDVRSITSSYPAQRLAILLAVHVVRSVLDSCSSSSSPTIKGNTTPKILIHTFSGGGPNSVTQLLIVLREQLGTPLPIVGILMDSGPGSGEYWKDYRAMLLSLPPGVMRILAVPVVHYILLGLAASVALGRYDAPATLFRRTMVDGEFVCSGREGKGMRICYVFSKEDGITHWEDVVWHAEIARGKGWEVDEWVVEGTRHCNHFSENEERYVGKMRGLWEG